LAAGRDAGVVDVDAGVERGPLSARQPPAYVGAAAAEVEDLSPADDAVLSLEQAAQLNQVEGGRTASRHPFTVTVPAGAHTTSRGPVDEAARQW